MEDIHSIARSITDASLLILTCQYKPLQSLLINGIPPLDHLQTTENPPGIAHIRQLFGPAIEATLHGLPLTEPPRQLLMIKRPQIPRNLQRAHTAENISSV